MKINKIKKCCLIISFTVPSSMQLSYAAEAEVKIDPSVQKYIGDSSVLNRDKFFNLHTSPTSSELTTADLQTITEELNAGFGRSFWSPLSASGEILYPSTDFAITQGAINIEQQKNNVLYPYSDRRMVATDHPKNIMREGNNPVEGARWAADYFENYYTDETRPLFYEPMNEPFVHASDFVDGGWDAEKNLVVQGQMTEWFKQIALEFHRRNIDTKVIGFSSAWPSVELNDFSHWEERQKRFMDVAGDAMDAFSFHLYDGVNVTGQDNIRSGSNAEAIMDLIETYSHYKWDTVKPHALTEYGGIIDGYEGVDYSDARSSQELPSLNHLLFSALEREDRILTSIPFITAKAAWFYQANNFQPYSAAIWRPDPSKVVGNKVNGFLLTEKAKFFQLWSEVKGTRIDVQELDPDLAVQAFAYGPKVYIALNNFEDTNKSVSLDFITSMGELVSLRTKRLHVPYGEAAIYSDESSLIAPSELLLAEHEAVVLEYEFAQKFAPSSVVRKQSYYADEHLQSIVAEQAINFSMNNVVLNKDMNSFTDYIADMFEYNEVLAKTVSSKHERKMLSIITSLNRNFAKIKATYPNDWENNRRTEVLIKNSKINKNMNLALNYYFYKNGFNSDLGTAMLRMGIARKHDKSKQPELKVNGHVVNVPNDWKGYNQATRADFFGSIEIPVPAKFLKQNNQISATFPDSDGRISSMILEVDKRELLTNIPVSGIEVNKTEMQINKDKPRRLHAQVLPANATDQFIVWSSSNSAVVEVDSNGVLTPKQAGFAIITAMANANNNQVVTTTIEVLDKISLPNTVTIIEDTSDEITSNNYAIKVAYSTDEDRDIAFEMRSSTNEWLGEARTTVYAGEGEVEIAFNLTDALPVGGGYRWTAGLRSIGGNWRTNVDSHSVNDIVIHPADWEYTDDSQVTIVTGTENLVLAPSYKVTVQYKAVVESDVTVDLSHASGWKAGARKTVQPGTGEVELTLWPIDITADSGYKFISAIREVGGNWQTDYANTVVENITISDPNVEPEPDTNLLVGLNSGFDNGGIAPWGYGWDTAGSVNVTVDAALNSDFGAAIDTSAGKVGLVLSHTSLPQNIYKPGKRLKVTFDAKRASNSGWVGGYAEFWNNANTWVSSGQKWFEVKNDWTAIEYFIDIPQDSTEWLSGSTHFQINFNKGGELFYFDNLVIEDVTP
ncbi:Ig-like domain-containing protein [Colwellia sp. UCD-KL20]|uniref:Ig-like domain-containing protein n=1 Tax=Colwellia sp. UCD-KL20 TaxID=1917165 RepID=UPI0011774FC6|nr:Ig-like domain-containing protein [Colwellia sp. UCD-KL20]